MKSLNDIIWNGDLDLEEGNGNIQFGEDPSLEQSCAVLRPECQIRLSTHPKIGCTG